MIADSDTIYRACEELKRRSEHDSNQYKPGAEPGWDQLSFHSSEDRYRLLFGGNQSGKSHSAAYEITCWLRGIHPHRKVPDPPVEIWAISAEYVTLQTGIYRHLRNLIPDWEIDIIGPRVPQQDLPGYIRLKNGSQVSFKSAKGESREKFQAAAVHLISIDEEVQENIWTELQARTLATGGQFIISATLVDSYDWILQLERLADAKRPGYFVTRLNTRKNPYLDKPTVDHLAELWSEEEKEVRLYGKSRRSVGLIYSNWNDKIHSTKQFKIPYKWPRWCAIDPGIRTCAVLWIAVNERNQAFAYRELYAKNVPLYEIAVMIRTLEGYKLNKELSFKYEHYVWDETDESEKILLRLIDDKEGSRLITGQEGVLDQLYNRYGIGCTPADKVLRPGIEDCRQWLEVGSNGEAGFVCFDHLENFLNERRRYRIRQAKPRKEQNQSIDEPIRKDNHLMDCWRYIAREKPRYSHALHGGTVSGLHMDEIIDKMEKETVHEFLGTEW